MSLDFDGTDDRINCSSPASLDNLRPVTLSFWASPDNLGENSRGVFTAKFSGTVGFEWIMSAPSTTRYTVTHSTTNLIVTAPAASITTGAWQHIALTWDGAVMASGVVLYVNAQSVAFASTQNAVGTPGSDASQNWVIGSRDTTGTNAYNGKLAWYQVFNRVLTIGEVRQSMGAPGSVRNGLVVFGTMLNDAASVDWSGNGTAWSVTGAVPFSTNHPPIAGIGWDRGRVEESIA